MTTDKTSMQLTLKRDTWAKVKKSSSPWVSLFKSKSLNSASSYMTNSLDVEGLAKWSQRCVWNNVYLNRNMLKGSGWKIHHFFLTKVFKNRWSIVNKTFPWDLFEDFALVKLAAVLVFADPLQVVVYHCLSLLCIRVQLLPVVWGVIDFPVVGELEGKVVALPHPDAGNGRVVVFAEQTHRRESVLA